MKTNEKTTDHTLVKECIFTALILLMEQQDYDKITITDITKKAGVSRMTYYRLYSSKEDILLQQFSKIIQELTDKIRQDSSLTPYRLVYQFFSFFQKRSKLVLSLKKANLLDLTLNTFITNVALLYPEFFDSPDGNFSCSPAAYYLYYHAGGLFSTLLQWIGNGQKESPEEMAQLMVSFMDGPFFSSTLHK